MPARLTTPLSPLGDVPPAAPSSDPFGPSAIRLSPLAASPSATPLSPLAASSSVTPIAPVAGPSSATPVSPLASPSATPLSPLADDSSRPVAAASAPGADTAFMEQVLLELSAQNEHARQEQGPEQPAAAQPAARGASPAGASPPRTRTVRVERDSEFRTPEGVPSARAYLPARTLAPGRTEPIETDRVHVADPRRLPTVRLPRERRDPAPRKAPGRAPHGASGLARSSEWSAPVPDETAPTLRSASPALMPPRRPDTRKWIGWMIVAALVGALVVAAIRFRSSRSGASPSAAPSSHPSVGAILRPSASPSASDPTSTATAAPSPSASDPTSTAAADASAPLDPSTHPSPGRKSDRWF